jgi:hypothetical protein
MSGLINRLWRVLIVVLLAGNALAGPVDLKNKSTRADESSLRQSDTIAALAEAVATQSETLAETGSVVRVTDVPQGELFVSDGNVLLLLLIAGCVMGAAVLMFVALRIRKELRFSTTEPASLCALEETVEHTLHFYGNKRMGKNGYRVLKCADLKQWIVMRAEPAAVFLERRQISRAGVRRLSNTRARALPCRQQVQELFETEALLVTLNPRRTLYLVHPCDCRRRPFFSENLSSRALYKTLKRAEHEGFFTLRRLPLGRWTNCPRQRSRGAV